MVGLWGKQKNFVFCLTFRQEICYCFFFLNGDKQKKSKIKTKQSNTSREAAIHLLFNVSVVSVAVLAKVVFLVDFLSSF